MARILSSRRTGPRASATVFPESLRREVTRRGEELLSRTFAPLLAHEMGMRTHEFNYAVAGFSEWRGRSFYLCVRYRTPRPGEEFVVRSARLEYAGRDRFHLAYFRHTNRWQPVYQGLTAEQCFDTIEQEEVFWPLT